MSAATLWKDSQDLVPPKVFDAVVATVRDNNPEMDDHLAQRIVREALKFVATCGRFRDRGMAPSRVVDEGWHALILHTRAYEELCALVGGAVHHYPERPDPTRYNGAVVIFTTSMMQEAGYLRTTSCGATRNRGRSQWPRAARTPRRTARCRA